METMVDVLKAGQSAFSTGGVVSGVCTLTVNGFEDRETFTLVGVTSASKIVLGLGAALDTDENDPEFLVVTSLCGLPGTDAFDVSITFGELTSGPIKINYMVI